MLSLPILASRVMRAMQHGHRKWFLEVFSGATSEETYVEICVEICVESVRHAAEWLRPVSRVLSSFESCTLDVMAW